MNISDIAKMAEVSVSAVSRYLNDGYISEEKKKRIKKVIEKTGYEPSKQAQVLRTKKSKVIGVIVPKIDSDATSRVVAGIHTVLSERGYLMLLTDTENDTENEIKYLNLLNNNPVDGIIFMATIFNRKHKETLSKLDAPVVMVGQIYENYPCVYHDDYNVARELTELMINAGRSRIGCIGVTNRDKAAGHSRMSGYKDALKGSGLPVQADMIKEGLFNSETGYEMAKLLLQSDPELDGIFCATDTIALGAMEYIKEVGKQIPKDISITGIGASKMAGVIQPKLTTARLHYKTSGIEGANILLDMIENYSVISKQIKLGYEVIEAESVQ